MVAMLVGNGACDGSGDIAGPPIPGSVNVTTHTSGFMKDDSYDLIVDGESKGTIGASAELTIDELDPDTHVVDLGDVAENCTVESVAVAVTSNQTANVSLNVVCAHPAADSYTIRFNRDRPNLDTGEVIGCPFGICSSNEEWDVYVYDNTSTDPESVIRQNQTTSVEIAHLTGVTLDDLTEEDVAGASFTTDLVADPFDAGRVILIRTDLGNLYALGNPVEDTTALTLTFDAVLLEAAQP